MYECKWTCNAVSYRLYTPGSSNLSLSRFGRDTWCDANNTRLRDQLCEKIDDCGAELGKLKYIDGIPGIKYIYFEDVWIAYSILKNVWLTIWDQYEDQR